MYLVDTLSFCMRVTLRLGVENLLEHTYLYKLHFGVLKNSMNAP